MKSLLLGVVVLGIVVVLSFLRRRTTPPPKAVRIDPAFYDPEARDLRAALQQGAWRPVQTFLEKTRDWDTRGFYVDALATLKGRPPVFDTWVTAAKDSSLALLLRGRNSIAWAWEARGSGQAKTVTDPGWKLFYERLKGADEDLVRAAELDPQDPTPLAYRLITARGLDEDREEVEARFGAAKERDPENRIAHEHMHVALCEKWGGSHDDMFEFARSMSKAAREGSPVHVLLAKAHIERWFYRWAFDEDKTHMNYWQDRTVQTEIRAAFDHSVGSARYRTAKTSLFDWNYFAFCFSLMNDHERARRMFDLIGERATDWPWGAFAGAGEKFAKERSRFVKTAT
ncbi:hypothetical protein HY251_04555 [bacterium]|nr:hypothetical protein [bacterium]